MLALFFYSSSVVDVGRTTGLTTDEKATEPYRPSHDSHGIPVLEQDRPQRGGESRRRPGGIVKENA